MIREHLVLNWVSHCVEMRNRQYITAKDFFDLCLMFKAYQEKYGHFEKLPLIFVAIPGNRFACRRGSRKSLERFERASSPRILPASIDLSALPLLFPPG